MVPGRAIVGDPKRAVLEPVLFKVSQKYPHSDELSTFLKDSIFPEPVKPARCQLRVPDSVLNISVSQIMLDRPSILTIIRQFEAAAMAEHVRVHGKSYLGIPTGTGNQLSECGVGQWTATFSDKDI